MGVPSAWRGQKWGSPNTCGFQGPVFGSLGFVLGSLGAPDGSCVLTCSNDNALRIFDLPLPPATPPGGAPPPAGVTQGHWESLGVSRGHSGSRGHWGHWGSLGLQVPAVQVAEGDTIYDFTWYPLMDSSDPPSCLVAASSRDSPVHLWDAFDGSLRGSFRAHNHLDEPVAPHSLAFSPDGSRLLGGFEGAVREFPTQRPGRSGLERSLRGEGRGLGGGA
ncbi:hypothetical protein DV515_00018337 [Chloebia gouldiae]|uniref:Telomerase Cajal body protein 1 n=1 Tax=Chloebia gouldiae TaxID=44316 RepID=A0A3L8Q7S0_CHLGU|nr:hypothetical protein DV515_00018337 [Chloebia gouldiae]